MSAHQPGPGAPRKVTVLQVLMVLAAWTGLQSCTPQTDEPSRVSLSATCAAPADQKESFMVPLQQFPIEISVDADFSFEERQSLYRAVSEWNAYGQESGNGDLFRIKVDRLTSVLRAADPHSCEDSSPLSSMGFGILRERSTDHWKSMGFNSQIPGATIRCQQDGLISRQVIYVYPELSDPTQIEKVFLHELGHSIGLDHSCLEGDGRAGFKGCKGLVSDHPYRAAVMYPWLQKRSASATTMSLNQREPLQSNDKLRAQCVVEK